MSRFPESSSPTEVLPEFVVAGVARAGTTSLASWLAQHPELHLSAVKETNFFSRPDLGTAGPGDHHLNAPPAYSPTGAMRPAHFAAVTKWEEYLRCFFPPRPGARLRGEVSVSYAFYPGAAERLARANPRARIVFVLREPLIRAYSNYVLFRKIGVETLPFAEALAKEDERMAHGFQFCWAYAGLSRYRAALRHFLRHFPVSQIHCARFEDLIEAQAPAAWQGLLRFLGVDPSFEPDRHHYNDTKGHQARLPLDTTAVIRLRRELQPEIDFYRELFASAEAQAPALERLRTTLD